jgi:hypothetical protein
MRTAVVLITIFLFISLAMLAVVAMFQEGVREARTVELERSAGPVPGEGVAMLGNALAAIGTIGGPQDLEELVGRRVRLTVDVGQAINDVAFWVGSPPSDLLVVMAQDERRAGDTAAVWIADRNTINPPPRGVVTIEGVIRKVPYAEATYSWGLTERDVDLLAERGVYVHAYAIVSPAPPVPGEHEPAVIDEHGRETAPPPGEQVETPLGRPPPPP